MSRFQSTILPHIKENGSAAESETEIRKMGLDLLQKINIVSDTLTTLQNTKMIYDSGSNANGSWIRFTDGTMSQWGSITKNFAISATVQEFVAPFPVNFLNVTIPTFSCTGNVYPTATFTGYTFQSVGFVSISLLKYVALNTSSAQDCTVTWQAIGKWR